MQIKCFEPSLGQEEIVSVTERIRKSDLGYGESVKEFERRFAKISGKKYNFGYSSASGAAFALFNYLYDKHGCCDVYVPSLTFNSPIWAAARPSW